MNAPGIIEASGVQLYGLRRPPRACTSNSVDCQTHYELSSCGLGEDRYPFITQHAYRTPSAPKTPALSMPSPPTRKSTQLKPAASAPSFPISADICVLFS